VSRADCQRGTNERKGEPAKARPVVSSLDCDLRSSPCFRGRYGLPVIHPRRTSYRDDGTSVLRALALLRLRIRARRFISTLRSSGVSFAQKALPAALAIFLRSDFGTPDQRLRPAARNLARGITITSSVLPIFGNFFTLTPAHLSGSPSLRQAGSYVDESPSSVLSAT
jgi:hypothetical protein